MSSVGPTAERKDERLERAVDVAGRLLDNIEIAIRGKREEVKLVLAALACKGHVLFEDVPGTAKTVLARAIAQSIEGAAPPDPVHPGPSADRRHGSLDLEPAGPGLRVQSRPDLRARRPRRRDQPRDAEDAVGAARGDGGAPGHDRRRHAGAERAVHRPRHRTRSSSRAPSRCPRRSSTAFRPNRARVSGRRRRAQHRPRPASRPSSRRARDGGLGRGDERLQEAHGRLRGRPARSAGSSTSSG